jgi:hypothetical protein
VLAQMRGMLAQMRGMLAQTREMLAQMIRDSIAQCAHIHLANLDDQIQWYP